MKKALFFRNCNNIYNFNKNKNKLTSYGTYLNYKIVKTIILKDDLFNEFISNFYKSFSFISENKKLMHMDKNDVVTCILIKNNNAQILIYSAGYDYARYIAII